MITPVALLALLASPSPAPGATPVCSRDATASHPVTPDFPASALGKLRGPTSVEVTVSVAPDGKVASERVTSTSGVAALDRSVLMAAAQSTYLPKMVNCKAVRGTYLFRVTFDPQQPHRSR